MTRQEILLNVYNKLRVTGAVTSRQDFANKIGYNYTCTSAAFNGAERYLNDKFFTRIIRAFSQVSEDYIRSGQGEILVADPETGEVYGQNGTGIVPRLEPQQENKPDISKLIATIAEQQELTRRQQEQTDKALAQIDQLIEIIRNMNNNMEA